MIYCDLPGYWATGRGWRGERTSSNETLHSPAPLSKCVEIVHGELISDGLVDASTKNRPWGTELGLRIIDRLQGGADLHAPLLCRIQNIGIRQDAVSGGITNRAQHEPGAGYNIYCGISQTTELEKDGWSHGHGEPYGRF